MNRKTRASHIVQFALRTLFVGICLAASVTSLHAQEVVYELVTSQSQLVDGGKYIIVDGAGKTAMGWQDTKNDNRKAADIAGKIEGNAIRGIVLATSSDDHTHVYEFSLYKNESSAGKWGFYDSVHKKFLCAHHLDQNGIELVSKTTAKGNPVPAIAEATISFQKTGGGKMVTMVEFPSRDKNSKRLVMSTYKSSVYACYADQSPTISLYRKRVGVISISQYGYTTYANKYRYRMPPGCTGYLVSMVDGVVGKSLLLTAEYKENDVVPEGTPLLIKGTPGEYGVYQTGRNREGNAGENLLHADYDEEGNVTYGVQDKANHYYYKLSTKNSTNLGFYWGASDGGPFKMKSRERAYLVLPREQSEVKGLVLGDAMEETGVALPVQVCQPGGKVYDLQGRSFRAPLGAGIYIRDGRKVLITR